jgi:ABC-type transport system substrate-binding protein
MNGVKIALAALISILLVMVIIDRSRQTEQLSDFKKSLDELNATMQKMSEASGGHQQSMVGPAQPQTTTTTTSEGVPGSPTAVDPVRDGNPKLNVNFLLPYETAHFHPQWLGGTLSGFGDTSKSINPLTDNSGTTQDVHSTINSSLCFRHPACPEQWMSGLAESLIISDDYKVYTFTLRKGIKWQRPTIASKPEFSWIPANVELTAADFVFYFQLIQNPDVLCPQLRVYYDDLAKAEALDDYTLRLTWKRKVYTSLASSMAVMPLPRHIYTRNRDGTPREIDRRAVQ